MQGKIYLKNHLLMLTLPDTKQLHVILDAKYKKTDLHKVMENQCQHLTMTQRNELLKLLQKFEELFYGTLGTWKTDTLDFRLK